MAYGKTIELFLVNGTAESIVTAELSNWNGKAIKIPRTEVSKCSRDDLRGIGVYFLICRENDGIDSVYIGEAEIIQDRLRQHIADYQSEKEKYYWHTAVAFVGRDLNKALIRFLEHRLVEIARESGSYSILTKNTYKNTILKESQIASMEEFIENVKVLMAALGYKVLVPAPQASDATTYLFCKGSGANAKGFISNGGFTVVKGSAVSTHTVPSMEVHAKSMHKLRNLMEEEKILADGVFTKDYEFTSPSAASTVVLGRSSNGNVDWKTAEGIKLKDLQ